MTKKKRVLIFCNYYLPGIGGAGGTWMIVNLVDRFFDRYDFFIVTRNHDSIGPKTPYDSVETNRWNTVGKAQVYFFDVNDLRQSTFAHLTAEIKPDAVFLNSVFSPTTIKFLMARRRKMTPDVPVILAPCGELPRVLLKRLSKRGFLRIAKALRLYQSIIWKASFEEETKEIEAAMGRGVEIWKAPDIAPKTILPCYKQKNKPIKNPGDVKFVFVSRVVAKKNLRYFLELLASQREGNVSLDIVGPLDKEYWPQCESIIKTLPENIKINISGPVSYEEALIKMYEAHFFVLPTLHENFGYVFIEALSAGCPLLISDRTVWTDIEDKGVGWILSLDKANLWQQRIRECIDMNQAEYEQKSIRARNYALNWLADPAIEQATARVLSRAMEGV